MRRKAASSWSLYVASFLAITIVAGITSIILQDNTGARELSINSPIAYTASPGAPLLPTAISGQSQITVNWLPPFSNGGSPINNYTIYRGGAPGAETFLKTIGNVLTYTDVGLINAQVYYYKVAAMNIDGTGPNSTEVSATPRSVPSAPINLVALHGNATVNLTWQVPASNGGSSILGYFVYRGTISGNLARLMIIGNKTSYNDTGVTNGQVYYYQISANNIIGEGNLSAEACSGIVGTPTAPRSLLATPGNLQVVLTWQAPLSVGGTAITNYLIYRGSSPGGESLYFIVGNDLTYTDTLLMINGQTYYYKVAARNSYGVGYNSNEASATPRTVPSAPRSLSATQGNAHIVLTWLAPLLNGGSAITNYLIFRGTVQNGETLIATIGNVNTYNSSGLVNGQIYFFKVAAVNAAGTSSNSSEVSTTPNSVPSAPRSLAALPGNAHVVLTWLAPSSNGGLPILNYNIYRGILLNGEILIATIGNVTTYNSSGLANGQIYYFKVTAGNTLGESPPSNETAAIPATVPGVPRSFAAVPGNGTVSLTWQAPESNGGCAVTSYNVYRSTMPGSGILINSTGNSSLFVDVGLSNAITYYYSVAAVNAIGQGTQSTEVNVTPSDLSSEPTSLASVSGPVYVILAWDPPLSNGGTPITSYNIYRGTTSDGITFLQSIGNITTFIDENVLEGVIYYYEVVAVSSVGEGTRSAMVCGYPGSSPSSPLDLQVYPMNQQILLTWQAPMDPGNFPVKNYMIYRGNSTTGFTLVPYACIGNVTTFLDRFSINGMNYSYAIAAINAVGEGPLGNVVSAVPETAVPDAPLNLTAVPGNGVVSLSWHSPLGGAQSGITNYTVYRGNQSTGMVPVLYTTLGNVTTFSDTGVVNGWVYIYLVCAVNASGEGSRSIAVSSVPATVPGSPSILNFIPGNRTLTITWNPPVSDGGSSITSYNIMRSIIPGLEGIVDSVDGNVTTYTDTGLMNMIRYFYKIQAVNEMGEGTPSDEASAIPFTTPNAPWGVTCDEGNSIVSVSWIAPLINGGSPITNYSVHIGTVPGLENSSTIFGKVLTCIITGLVNGQKYYFRIGAINAAGEGALSSEISATPMTVPEPPLSLVASSGNGWIYLQWQSPGGNGGSAITTYRIYRGESSGGESFLANAGNTTVYNDTAVVNGRHYYYYITALNTVGESFPSNEASMIPRTTPDAPLSLIVTAFNNRLDLSWQAPLDNGGSPITGYAIYRGTTSGNETSYTSIGNITGYTDNNVTNGLRYYYKVAAINDAGEGLPSIEADDMPVGEPSAPRNLIAVYGNLEINLMWQLPTRNGGVPILGYTIYRSQSPGSEIYQAVVNNVTFYNDVNVTNGQQYYYKVAAFNAIGNGNMSNEATTIPIGTPSPPRDVFTSIGNRFVLLNWQIPVDNGGAAILGYVINRSTLPGAEASITLIGNVTSYNDTSVTNGLTYYYKIAAVNAIGVGLFSSEVNATPLTTATVPRLLTAIPGNGTIKLNWQVPVDNGGSPVTGYAVFRGQASGSETYLTTIGNLTSYEDPNLSNGQTYYYTVLAKNAAGNSSLSNEASAMPRTVPGVVLSLAATPVDRSIFLTWQPPVNNGGSVVTGYCIYRGMSPGTGGVVASIGNVTTYNDTGLVNGAHYYYKVSAVNVAGEGNVTGEIIATPVTLPGLPLNVQSSVGNQYVNLTWNPPTSNGGAAITGYKIYRGNFSGGEILVALPGNMTSFANTGLVNGQQYYFRVSTVSSVGEGPLSVVISVVPRTVPGTPRGLTITNGNGTARLSWLRPASNGGAAITGYKIYRGSVSGGELLVATIGNVTSFIDTGLVNGRIYYYLVRAENVAGISSPSSEGTVIPSEGNASGDNLPLSISEIVAFAIASLSFLILGRSRIKKFIKSTMRRRRYHRMRSRLAASLKYGTGDQSNNQRTTMPPAPARDSESIRAKMGNTKTLPGFTEVRGGVLKRTPPKTPAIPGITDTKPRTPDKLTARVSDRVPLNQGGWNTGVAAKAGAVEELVRYDAVAGDQPGSDLRATEQAPGDERGNFPLTGSDSPTGASNEKDRKDDIDEDTTSS